MRGELDVRRDRGRASAQRRFFEREVELRLDIIPANAAFDLKLTATRSDDWIELDFPAQPATEAPAPAQLAVRALGLTGTASLLPVGADAKALECRLTAADGAESRLHRFSVGVAKPILLAPKQRTTANLLFNPLAGKASELRVYDEVASLTTSDVSEPQVAP